MIRLLVATTTTLCLVLVVEPDSASAEPSADELGRQYSKQVLPLVQKYCVKCHSADEKKGDLNLARFDNADTVRRDTRVWQKVLRRLRGGEMPPKKSPSPSPEERNRLIDWAQGYLLADARERAGDPGRVLVRRLTRAEYNYTVRDLTGVDLRPAEKFLEDSVAGEGFANTGEALFMAPDLIPKYLDAARQFAAHAVLTPDGIRFSPSDKPHDWIVESAQRIEDFYARYVDRDGRLPLSAYLEATVRYRERDAASKKTLDDFAAEQKLAPGRKLSPKYLHLLWDALNDPKPNGEMAEVVRRWREAKSVVVKGLYDGGTHIEEASSSDPADVSTFEHPPVPGKFDSPMPYGLPPINGKAADQGFIWQSGSHFVVDFGAAKEIDLVRLWSGYGGGVRGAEMEVSFAAQPRGPFTVPKGGLFDYQTSVGGGVQQDGSTSPDTTGFYNYTFEPAVARYWRIALVRPTSGHMPRTTTIEFGPMPDVIAPEVTSAIALRQAKLWKLNRQVNHLIGSIGLFGSYVIPQKDEAGQDLADSETYTAFADLFPMAACFAPVIPVNRDVTVELFLREDEALSRLLLDEDEQEQLDRLWKELRYVSHEPSEVLYNTKQFIGFQPADRLENTNKFSKLLPSLEAKVASFTHSLRSSEEKHLDAVIQLADRAWRRPLSKAERHDLRQMYTVLRSEQALSHDAAIRTLLTRVLVSPNFLYRVERPAVGKEAVALTDLELASRLSYFLWSSLPDEALRSAAAKEQLKDSTHRGAHARRMLADPRARALATEFAGQWLQFRGFDQYDGKSESRFPTFTAELRSAMSEEAIGFIAEIIGCDRSVLDMLRADYTFLNEELAAHYNIPDVEGHGFRRVDGVSRFGRGGIATLGSVLTKQSGALRTSPVLRGTWVVDTLLGREIPNPPDDVPQLDEDEVNKEGLTMRQRLERHQADASCATCHSQIDPYGFALEAYDPIGRLRDKDLNGNPIDARAKPNDGEPFEGLNGLQTYLLKHQDEFIRQFCRKLLGYALGRAVELSDELLLTEMQSALRKNDYRFSSAVLTIVNSKQFLQHRGRNDPQEASP